MRPIMSWSVATLQRSSLYLLRDFWRENADQRVASDWLVKNGLLNTLAILGVYLFLVKVALPKFMANRPAMSLKGFMIIYNLTMASVNLYCFIWLLLLTRGGVDLFNFVAPSENDRSPGQMALITFGRVYFFTKFLDLIETGIFCLRKKNSQLTFLHLYHHTIVPIIGTVSFALYPTSMAAAVFAYLNSFVHVIMYAYYGLAAFGPHMQPYLWWKKYITQLQILQFIIFIFFAIGYSFFSQGYSMAYVWIGISQAPFFAFLFIRFYLRSYQASKGNHQKGQQKGD